MTATTTTTRSARASRVSITRSRFRRPTAPEVLGIVTGAGEIRGQVDAICGRQDEHAREDEQLARQHGPMHVRLGMEVAAGDALATVHSETPGELDYALEYAASHGDLIEVEV